MTTQPYPLDHPEPIPCRSLTLTGAGDAFCGGFLAGYRSSYDPLQAALTGNISAPWLSKALILFMRWMPCQGWQKPAWRHYATGCAKHEIMGPHSSANLLTLISSIMSSIWPAPYSRSRARPFRRGQPSCLSVRAVHSPWSAGCHTTIPSAMYWAACRGAQPDRASTRPLVVSAHLDTVHPLGTPLSSSATPTASSAPVLAITRLGLAGLFWPCRAVGQQQVTLPGDLWLAANMAEEGLGNLKGCRRSSTGLAAARWPTW